MAYLGHRPAVGENNSFRILDDISSYVLTFDGSSASAVSLSNETIIMTDDKHRYITGQRVTYSNGGGGDITGLTNGQAYFVINHSSTEIKLASSASNALAGTAVDLTGLGTGSSHTLTLAFDGVNTKFVPTFGNGLHDALIKRAAQLVISLNGIIQQPHDTATPTTGFGVDALGNIIFSNPPISTDIFWAHVLASNTVTFDSSDNDVDTFTGDGSTTSFTLSKVPPDNRNILVTIDGVVQYPSDAANIRSYNVSENVMTFVSAPGNGTVIQVRHIGYAGASAGGGGGGVTGFYGRTGNVSLQSTDNIVANNATFYGNVSIAQTLTYEDVTNVDAVGLITARSGIKDQTLTAGHVVFAGTGGRLSGEADLFYDASNNRLGIGSATPAEKLDVAGNIKLGSNGVKLSGDEVIGGGYPLKLSTDSGYVHIGPYNTSFAHFVTDRGKYYFNKRLVIDEGIISSYNEDLIFKTDNDSEERVRIKNDDGSVGIGTTVMGAGGRSLTLAGTTNATITIRSGTNNNGNIYFADGTTGSAQYMGMIEYNQQHNRMSFHTNGDTSNPRLRITSSGAVGINTTVDAATQLQVQTDATGTTAGGNIVARFQSNGSGRDATIQLSDNVAHSATISMLSSALIFKQSGTETLHIKSNGRVGINTDNPNAQLDVYKTGTGTVVDTIITRTSGGGAFAVQCSDVAAANPVWALRTYSSEDLVLSPGGHADVNEKVRIKADTGYVGIGTDNPTYVLHTFNDGVVGSAENSRKYNGRFTTFTPNRLNLDIYDRRWQDTQTHGWTGTEKRIEYNVDDNATKRMWISFFNPSSTTPNNVIRFGEQEDTEWMRIYDGKVGIGQPTPATTLEIKSDANAQTTATIPTLRITNDDGSASIDDITGSVEFFTEDTSDPNHISAFMRNISETNAGVNYSLIFGTKSSNITGDATEKLRIRSDGNVGIGTDNPTQLLTLARSSAGQSEFGLRFQYVNETGPTQTSSGLLVGSYGLKLKNYNSNRNFLFETGSVGIGTDNPNMALHVLSTSDDVARFQSTNSGNGTAITLDHIGGSPADNDIVGKIVFNGQDDALNSTTYADIRCITSDVSDGSETAHLDFSTRGLGSFNSILRLNHRSTASAPSYTADDHNGIILDVHNTGNPYPRYMNFIAKSAGNTDSNIDFWTETVGGSPIDRLRIDNEGSLRTMNKGGYWQITAIHNGSGSGNWHSGTAAQRIYPNYIDNNTGYAEFYMTFHPTTSYSGYSSPTLIIRGGNYLQTTGEIAISYNGRTNSPTSGVFRALHAQYQWMIYNDGDGDAYSGMRSIDRYTQNKTSAFVDDTTHSIDYVHSLDSRYGTNTEPIIDQRSYIKIKINGVGSNNAIQGHTIFCKFVCYTGGDKEWTAYMQYN